MRAKFFTFLILGIVFSGTSLNAQSVTARLEGVIRDQTQAVIPGVSVTATNESTNIGTSAITNETGRYIFVSLTPGTYTVTAELAGFKKAVQTGLIVQVGDAKTLDIVLQPGDISQDVTVIAETPLLDLTTTKIGSVVEERQVLDLPLNGRNAMMLFYLAAGVNPLDRLGSQQQTGGADGLAPHTNNVKVEGIFNGNAGYDYTPAYPNTPVPQEAIGEYRITTSGASAEAGRGSGAKVSVYLKSGTNQIHGSVFEYNRNTVMSANNFFNNRQGAPRPQINRNQYGVSLGGPIIKNRTFFFGTIEWQRLRQGQIQNRQVYTPAMRQGIFRYNTQRATSINDVDRNGNPLVPFGTINVLTIDPTRQGLDPVYLPKLLAVMPPPNNYDIGDGLNLGGYRYTTSRPEDYQQYLVKIDHELLSRHHLALSYSNWRLDNPQLAQLNGFPAEGFVEIRRGGSVRLMSSLTPRITNELSIGANMRWSLRPILNRDQETPAGNIMLQVWGDGGNGNTSGNININRGFQSNPAVNMGFSDSLSWIKGNHTLSMGGELWFMVMNRQISIGWPIIRTTQADNPANVPALAGLNANDRSRAQQLVNDMTGSVGRVTQSFFLTSSSGYTPYSGNYQQLRQLEWAPYFQDIWKFSPTLTITAGLRYETLHPGWIANGAFVNPVGGVAGALGIQGPRGQPTRWDFAPNKGRGIMKTDWNNFAPTLGFSWDPFGKANTTISGSYGLSYDRSMMVVYGEFSAANYGANSQVQKTPFMTLRDPRFYREVLPIPTPTLFAPLGFTRDSRAYAVDSNLTTPYVQNWTFRISRQIGTEWKVDAAYVGNHAVGQWRAENLNQVEIRKNGFLDAFKAAQRNLARNNNPLQGESLGALDALFRLVPASQNNLIAEGQAAALANFLDTTTLNTGVRGGLVERAGLPNTFFRFNPQVQNLNIVGNRTHSTWNAMKLIVSRRLHQGLYAQLNYTLGKGFTDYIPGQDLYDNDYRDIRNHRLDRSLMDFDSTHVLTFNWIYELPVGRGKRFMSSPGSIAQGILGGWQFNGIYNLATGRPLEITTNRQNLNQLTNSIPNFTGKMFHMSDVQKGNIISVLTPQQRAQFSNPAPGEAGDLPRRSMRGPGFSNFDLSLFKKFPLRPLGETSEVQFRLEFYNALNQVNFVSPTGNAININSGSFGVLTSARDARIGQLGLKFVF